jgi:hypothetical protein
MHRWQEPFERVTGLTTERGIPLATPRMGERLDLGAPHHGERWWREAAEVAQAPGTLRRWLSCRQARQANS